jgi:hypothetical protein
MREGIRRALKAASEAGQERENGTTKEDCVGVGGFHFSLPCFRGRCCNGKRQHEQRAYTQLREHSRIVLRGEKGGCFV